MNQVKHIARGILGSILLCYCSVVYAQSPGSENRAARLWADSVINTMNTQAMIGQLFMVATFSKGSTEETNATKALVDKYKLGGLIFMQGTPGEQARLVNLYQDIADVPLMIGQDAEYGLGMRLSNTMRFPRNMTLGAIRSDSLLFETGKEYARQLQAVGVKVNFAPVVDINNNPANPVINDRSFGENKYNVARKAIMLSKGMESHGVLACIKHFPGHGDTDTDSHVDLPVIKHSLERLDTLELYPFARAMEAGVGGVMVAHMYVPALDATPNLATTLSPFVVKEMIRKRMNYKGLIFTDALNMKGVTKYHQPGVVEVKAFLAGNDVLLFPENVPRAIEGMKRALAKGIVDTLDLQDRVRNILVAKYKLGLTTYNPIPTKNLEETLSNPEALILRKRLYEASLTLVRNEAQLLPLKNLDKKRIAYIQIGTNAETDFEKSLKKYSAIRTLHLPSTFSAADVQKAYQALDDYTTIIFGVFNLSKSPGKKYGYNPQINSLAAEFQRRGKKTILAIFGSPYSLTQVGDQEAILMAYESAPDAQNAAAMAIFGGMKVDGRLPVSAGNRFPEGTGLQLKEVIRFGFAIPEEEGINGNILNKIDSLANHFIKMGAMPGCAILVGKGNSIIYEKGFGKTEYGAAGKEIDPYFHMYDLASVTKIAATTLIAMKLVEEGSLKLDAPVEKYLPELKGSDKAKLTSRRLLQHNSGLPAWRPFYRDTYIDIDQKKNDPRFYRTTRQDSFTLVISSELFGHETLPDTIWKWIQGMTVKPTRKVRYSDIGMIMMGKILENQVGTNLDRYLRYKFYLPLGMVSTHYTPALKGIDHRCPPTLVDDYWRYSKLQGYVHDESSAIMGGRTGHAGLFSNVYDMAKLLFMLKNGGKYGGETFFKPETIKTFTKQQLDDNRKGLGWDKPEIYANRTNPASDKASKSTFGHTGFTGTCVWVDPDNDLIYIFLSNRTYPKANNRMLMRENVRTKIMDQIYLAMKDGGNS